MSQEENEWSAVLSALGRLSPLTRLPSGGRALGERPCLPLPSAGHLLIVLRSPRPLGLQAGGPGGGQQVP